MDINGKFEEKIIKVLSLNLKESSTGEKVELFFKVRFGKYNGIYVAMNEKTGISEFGDSLEKVKEDISRAIYRIVQRRIEKKELKTWLWKNNFKPSNLRREEHKVLMNVISQENIVDLDKNLEIDLNDDNEILFRPNTKFLISDNLTEDNISSNWK